MVLEYLSALSHIALAAFLWYLGTTQKGTRSMVIMEKAYIALSATFFVFGMTSLLWTTKFFEPSYLDSLAAGAILNSIVVLILALAIYAASREPSIIIISVLLLLTIFAIGGTFYQVFLAIWLVAEIVALLIFLSLTIVPEKYLRLASLFGIAYFAVNIYFIDGVASGQGFHTLPALVPNVFLGAFLYVLSKHRLPIGTQVKAVFPRFESSALFFSLRATVFIIAMLVFLIISTVSIHELGHAVSARLQGCSFSKAIIFDGPNLPHSDIECENQPSILLITLGGLAGTLLVGLLFIISGSGLAIRMGYIILGLGLFMIQRDLSELGVPAGITAIVIGAATLITLIGLLELSSHELTNLHSKLIQER